MKFPNAGFLRVTVGAIPGAPGDCAIAYSPTGLPVIVYSYRYDSNTDPNGPTKPACRVMFAESYVDGNGALAWHAPVQIHQEGGYAVITQVWPNLSDFSCLHVEFGKHAGHENDIHIVYTGSWYYYTLAQARADEEPTQTFSVWAQRRSASSGWSGPIEIESNTSSMDDRYPHSDISLAVAAGCAPQIAYHCGNQIAAPRGIRVCEWDDVSGYWIPEGGTLFDGQGPWLAIDPLNGDRHLGYEYYNNGLTSLLYTCDSTGSWSTPVYLKAANSGTSYRLPRIAVERSLALNERVMQVLYTHSSGSVHVMENLNGVWQDLPQWPQVSADGTIGAGNRIVISPELSTSPWILSRFKGNDCGVAWHAAPPGGCGSTPVSRNGVASKNVGRALVPLLMACLLISLYFVARRKRGAALIRS